MLPPAAAAAARGILTPDAGMAGGRCGGDAMCALVLSMKAEKKAVESRKVVARMMPPIRQPFTKFTCGSGKYMVM